MVETGARVSEALAAFSPAEQLAFGGLAQTEGWRMGLEPTTTGTTTRGSTN
jgi:hypothetical protein